MPSELFLVPVPVAYVHTSRHWAMFSPVVVWLLPLLLFLPRWPFCLCNTGTPPTSVACGGGRRRSPRPRLRAPDCCAPEPSPVLARTQREHREHRERSDERQVPFYTSGVHFLPFTSRCCSTVRSISCIRCINNHRSCRPASSPVVVSCACACSCALACATHF